MAAAKRILSAEDANLFGVVPPAPLVEPPPRAVVRKPKGGAKPLVVEAVPDVPRDARAGVTGGWNCMCKGTEVVEVVVHGQENRNPTKPLVVFSGWRMERTGIPGAPVPWAPGESYIDVLVTDARTLPEAVRRASVPCPSCQDPATAVGRTLILTLFGRIMHGSVFAFQEAAPAQETTEDDPW